MVIEEMLEDPELAKLEKYDALALRNYIESFDHRHPVINVSTMFNIINYMQTQ